MGHSLWDLASGRNLRSGDLRREPGAGLPDIGFSFAFSPDGRRLASGTVGGAIRVYDTGTGAVVRSHTGHGGYVYGATYSRDGRFMVSAGIDGTARLWDAETGEQLAILPLLQEPNEWLVVAPDGRFDGTPRAWGQILWRFSGSLFDVSPVEVFFNEYFSPGLLADAVAGRRPATAPEIARKDRRQPTLRIARADAETGDGAAASRYAKVTVEVREAPPGGGQAAGSGARDVRLFRNGSLVKAWRGDVLRGSPEVRLVTTVPLVAGENSLTAYAFNRDNIKSEDATLTLAGAESLRRPGTEHILVVGIDEYANPRFNLKFAVADARAFGDDLERRQAELGSYARIDVVRLLDGHATKANILGALARLAGAEGAPGDKELPLERLAAAQPEDAVVIYFAGHGVAYGDRFYLVPHDLGYEGERADLRGEALERVLARSISDQELERAFEGIDAGRVVLVIDACHSGHALEAEEKRRGPMNSRGLAQLAYEKGMYVLAAAQAYQAALEASQLGHGYLTYVLVEGGLKTPAPDLHPSDGETTLREWLDYAARRVPALQEAKAKESRKSGREIVFVEGGGVIGSPAGGVQKPRVFYRRETEARPFVVARRPATVRAPGGP
jgi:hypothetical protein